MPYGSRASNMEAVNFVTMFFVSKKISLLTAFVCWPPGETTILLRSMTSFGIRLRVYSDFSRGAELPAYDAHAEGVLLDVDCPGAEVVLRRASSTRAFIHRYSWLLLQNSSFNASTIEDVLATVDVLPDADVIWSSNDTSVDVYKIKKDQSIILTPVDLDRSDSHQRMEAMWNRWPTSVKRRKDLDNIFLKSATIISQPQHFKGWSDLTNRHIDTFPKLTYPLMMLLAEDLHFRLNLRQVDLYGEEHNGSFTGLAGILQRQEIEVGVTSMFMRADRMRVLHFCSETVELKGAFIFRQPSQSAVSNVFLLPFSKGVWLCCGLVLLLAALLLAALTRWLVTSHPNLKFLTLPECFSFAIGTICQQGFHITPDVVSIRLVMFFTLISSLFAFTSYSAKIVAILQTPSNAIQTIDDLTRSPMTLGVQETTYKRVYFAESTEPATQRLYQRKLLPLGDKAYLSVVDGVARLRTGLFAFQVEQGSGYDIISKTFTEHEKCGLQEIQAFKMPMVAVPVRKHTGYRELFASRLRWQRETGLMARARRRWLSARPRCDARSGGFLSVGLADVVPAVQILAYGATIAALVLGSELAIYHTKNRHVKRSRRWNPACGAVHQ